MTDTSTAVDDPRPATQIEGSEATPEPRRRIVAKRPVELTDAELGSRSEQKLRANIALARKIGPSTSRSEFARNLVQGMLQALPHAESGCLYISGPQSLELVSKYDRTEDANTKRIEDVALAESVAEAVEALLVEVFADETPEDESAATLSHELWVPLVAAEGCCVGVIQLRVAGRGDSFSMTDLDMLVGVAPVVSMAVQNLLSLEETTNRFRALVENSYDVIATFDAQGTPTYVTPSITRVLGYRPEELIGRPGLDILHPDDVAEAGQAFARGLERRGEPMRMIHRLRHKDGSYRTVEVTGVNLLDVPGVHAMVSNFRDITQRVIERKIAEQQLRQRDAELAHMSRVGSMGEMAAALAHELNQPLGTIANFAGTSAHLLRIGKSDPDTLIRSIDRINAQALHAGQIIRRLKRFVAQTVANRENFQVNKLVEDVVQLLAESARQQQITVETELDESMEDVSGDSIQIQQVLVNLLSNAFDAMESTQPTSRQVVIATSQQEDRAVIEVRDRGCGLESHQIHDIFEPYITTKKEGLGMGLPIIRRIVQTHGGEISARPNPAEGATFKFWLPAVGKRVSSTD